MSNETHLVRFRASGKLVVAVLESYPPDKKGGGVAFAGGWGEGSWDVPRLTSPDGSNPDIFLLSMYTGAILGAWFAGQEVSAIPQLATRTVTTITGQSVDPPCDIAITQAPSSMHGWVWRELWIVKSRYWLFVDQRNTFLSIIEELLLEVK